MGDQKPDVELSDAFLAAFDEAFDRWNVNAGDRFDPFWSVIVASEWTSGFTDADWEYLTTIGDRVPVPDELVERHEATPLLSAATLGMERLVLDHFDRWAQDERDETEAA